MGTVRGGLFEVTTCLIVVCPGFVSQLNTGHTGCSTSEHLARWGQA